jgi:hypothetical protein
LDAAHRPGWGLIGVLGVTQIVSWGSLYYAFPLLLAPIEQELGWQRASVVGAFSLSLLIAGAAASRPIDRRVGGRADGVGFMLGGIARRAEPQRLARCSTQSGGLGACMAARSSLLW